MIKTGKHLAYELKVELSEIDHIIKNIDNFYYQKETIKTNDNGEPKIKNGIIQKRVLNPSIRRLKVIQKRLQKNILQKLTIPDYAYGAIKGKDNISNAKRHQGKKYIFTTDLTNFFPSVNHKQVFEMFISFDFSPSVARLLTKLTTYKGKLPQGAPTSPIVANLVFVKTGKRLKEIAIENNLTFTSFVDDLTFSSPTDFKDKIQDILDAVVEDGFKISHKKTNYKTKLPTVTGVIVKNNSLDLPKEFKDKMNDESQSKERQIGLKRYHDRVLNYGKK
ncbi:MAG TPA: reverse transcriptase family protein [Brumimicrobium sp.]|nr:reverse transcriptase family protein [Brumimicrobium sp.]